MPYITKFVIIDEPLYYYRHGHESLSSSSRLNDYEMIKNSTNNALNFAKNTILTVMYRSL